MSLGSGASLLPALTIVKIFRIFCASNFYGFLIFAHRYQGLMSKSQGLVKRKSRLFSTSRRGIFTRSNLFSLIFEHKNRRNSPVMTIPPKFLYKYTTKFFEIQILFFLFWCFCQNFSHFLPGIYGFSEKSVIVLKISVVGGVRLLALIPLRRKSEFFFKKSGEKIWR